MKTLTYIAFAFAIIELALFATNQLGNQPRYAFGIAQLMGGMYILNTGNVRSEGIFKVLQLFLGMLILGVLFRILHWHYASEVIIVGSVGISITYIIRTFKKTSKQAIDWAKLGWISTVFIGYGLHILQQLPLHSFQYLTLSALLIVLGLDWWQRKKLTENA